jgi:hypothetical protein
MSGRQGFARCAGGVVAARQPPATTRRRVGRLEIRRSIDPKACGVRQPSAAFLPTSPPHPTSVRPSAPKESARGLAHSTHRPRVECGSPLPLSCQRPLLTPRPSFPPAPKESARLCPDATLQAQGVRKLLESRVTRRPGVRGWGEIIVVAHLSSDWPKACREACQKVAGASGASPTSGKHAKRSLTPEGSQKGWRGGGRIVQGLLARPSGCFGKNTSFRRWRRRRRHLWPLSGIPSGSSEPVRFSLTCHELRGRNFSLKPEGCRSSTRNPQLRDAPPLRRRD